eukprot:365591-Chlamydomonas_euryale.AAC.8
MSGQSQSQSHSLYIVTVRVTGSGPINQLVCTVERRKIAKITVQVESVVHAHKHNRMQRP